MNSESLRASKRPASSRKPRNHPRGPSPSVAEPLTHLQYADLNRFSGLTCRLRTGHAQVAKMRAEVIGLLLSAVLLVGPASAYEPYDPANCTGADWDDKRALVVSKVTAKPRVNFVKSPYDDDFK